jgi:hypothetical protein
MPAPDAEPLDPPSRPPDLLPVREFYDRGALWLFEEPQSLRGLLQILEPALAEAMAGLEGLSEEQAGRAGTLEGVGIRDKE